MPTLLNDRSSRLVSMLVIQISVWKLQPPLLTHNAASLVDPVLYDSEDPLQDGNDAFDPVLDNSLVDSYLPDGFQCQQISPSIYDLLLLDPMLDDLDSFNTSHGSNEISTLTPRNVTELFPDLASTYSSHNLTPPHSPQSSSPKDTDIEAETIDVESPDDSTSRARRFSNQKASQSNKVTKRIPHAMVERRYRETIKKNMEHLRRALPLAAYGECDDVNGRGGDSTSNSDSEHTASKISKAAILSSAVDYIRKIERENLSLAEKNSQLSSELARMRCLAEILRKRLLLTQIAARRGNGVPQG